MSVSSSIEVTVKHSPLAFIYYLLSKPTIEINGKKERTTWGMHSFVLPPGHYEISVSYFCLFAPECGKSTAEVTLEAGQTRKVTYRAGLIQYLPGRMRVS
jgi:hypothetical protein